MIKWILIISICLACVSIANLVDTEYSLVSYMIGVFAGGATVSILDYYESEEIKK